MKIHFTGDGRQSFDRTRYLWGALIKNYHLVSKSRRRRLPPPDCDVWFHDVEAQFPFAEHLTDRLQAFEGSLVFYRTDDRMDFPFDKIPSTLLSRARLFLASHWRAEASAVPESVRDRWGYINPILNPLSPRPGKQLRDRRPSTVFYGVRTGGKNLPGDRNSREEAVRLLRGKGLPFEGGLVHGGEKYENPEDLLVPRLSKQAYLQRFDETSICLCLWGNCPLTYRFFEGLSRRNLVVSQSLSGLRFARAGLEAGVHYIEIAGDLSDMLDKLDYYLTRTDEAQRIADAGYELFESNFAFRGLDFPQPLFDDIQRSWGGLLEPVRNPTLKARSLRRVLPWIKNLPTDRPVGQKPARKDGRSFFRKGERHRDE
jgi:hypothetical protein